MSDNTTPAFRSARRKGYEAQKAGKSTRTCPYPDWRTHRGAVTWGSAFRTYWMDGYRLAERGEPLPETLPQPDPGGPAP